MANNPVEEVSQKEEKKYAFKDPNFDVSIDKLHLNSNYCPLFN